MASAYEIISASSGIFKSHNITDLNSQILHDTVCEHDLVIASYDSSLNEIEVLNVINIICNIYMKSG